MAIWVYAFTFLCLDCFILSVLFLHQYGKQEKNTAAELSY